jgi:hypothetical protein
MAIQHSMTASKKSAGFALFAVIILMAIIGLISSAMVNVYLVNTRATSLDLQRIKAGKLLDSGVRFAALSLASPRAKVSASAVPSRELIYSAPDADVAISLKNESGFIDLISADTTLLKSVLLANGAVQSDLPEVIESIKLMADSDDAISYRALRDILQGTAINVEGLVSVATLHNGKMGVNPALASERVLELVPKLSNAERNRLLSMRNDSRPSLISNPIESVYFTSHISSYYRVAVSVLLNDQIYSKVQIIKMINQTGRLYQVVATL